MTNYTDARQQALLVKNATEDGSNTAYRVGGAMETIIEYTHDAVAGTQESLNNQIEQETTTRETDDAAIIARMRGDEEHHDNYDDPLLRKTFNGTAQDAEKGKKDATAWLNTLHTTDVTNKKPIGQIRIDIDGSSVWVLSNVLSYATDVWSQTLYNANVVYEDGVAIVHPGEDVYTRVSKPLAERESVGDVWYDWQKLAKNSDIASYVNGHFAPLENGKIPTSYIPGAAPEVEEYASTAVFPVSGSTAKIYIALDTNKQYRWSGTQYVEISASLALGETSATAFAGDRGKTMETKVGTLESTVSGQSSTITTLGQNVSTLQGNFADLQESVEGDIEDMEEAIEGTAAVVELTDYMTGGSKAGQALPLNAVYLYDGSPILAEKYIPSQGKIVFQIALGEGYETGNSPFFVFSYDDNDDCYKYDTVVSYISAPTWMLREFGEATATDTAKGLMSAADHKLLFDTADDLAENYYTRLQVDEALGDKASVTSLSNEVTRARNAETALGNSVTALQIVVGGKVSASELTSYMAEGTVLPFAGVYTYEGKPASHLRVIQNGANAWDLLFCVSHVDASESTSAYYLRYHSVTNGWAFDDAHDSADTPAWIKRAFGEAEATTSYPGMMSAEDKTKVDDMSEALANIETLASYDLSENQPVPQSQNLVFENGQSTIGHDNSSDFSYQGQTYIIDWHNGDYGSSIYSKKGTLTVLFASIRPSTSTQSIKVYWSDSINGYQNNYANAQLLLTKSISFTQDTWLVDTMEIDVPNDGFLFVSGAIVPMTSSLFVLNATLIADDGMINVSELKSEVESLAPITEDSGNLVFDGKVITFNQDGSVTWTAVSSS